SRADQTTTDVRYYRKRFIRGMMVFPHNNSWLGYGFAGDKPPRYEVFRCYLWLTPMARAPA
ncbi:MAG: hypothetical protein JXA30_21825, partial [Deltaproteobacteria bacterium]|nr:hypothetical protein [Deltaproteobacteria bacterium]